MGVCAHKNNREVVEPCVSAVPSTALDSRRVKNSLLDMRKAKCAPILTLNRNSMFKARVQDYSSRLSCEELARKSVSSNTRDSAI